ncbi:hypothetical protein D1BOALGB6SA_1178 [Olavius sp. associated proteobacterium Delta 1]|nr:hypothetical protein D1BOALGB6SA_1178 [Olavius sp. associated proteobacterium Delta 1]
MAAIAVAVSAATDTAAWTWNYLRTKVTLNGDP